MAHPKLSPFAKQCFVTMAVGVNLIGHGAMMGFPAVLLPQLHQENSPIPLTKAADSWIASVIGITLIFGSLIAAPIMGLLGRKMAHYTISVASIFGWTVTIFSNSFEMLLFARIVKGISFGMMLPLRSILIGEYTSPRNRGAFLTTIAVNQGLGIFFVHVIGSLLAWHHTAIVCIFLPFTSLIMTLFTPESPSWLAAKGRYDECQKEFRWLRGDNEDTELEAMIQARKDFDRAKTAEPSQTKKKFNVIATIKKKEFYFPVTLMFHVNVLGQLSGGSIMASYSMEIIKLMMNPGVNAEAWMIGLDLQRIVSNILAVYLINKLRRRTMLIACGLLCLGSHLAIIIYEFLRVNLILTDKSNWLSGMFLSLQLFSFAIGLGPLPSVITGEIFPLEFRSISASICLVASSGTLFLILKTFTSLKDIAGLQGTYGVYAIFIEYCLIVVWLLMPETKGKTLQQIENLFKKKYRKVGDIDGRESCMF